MDIYPDFQELFKNLNAHGVEYVVVGGYAMAHHGWPRYTKDIDILLAANPSNAKKIIKAIDDFGFGDLELTEKDFEKPRFFIRLGREPIQIDLLTTIPGVKWNEIWEHRSKGNYGDVPTNYIGRKQFVEAKRAAGRLQDLADIEQLGEDP